MLVLLQISEAIYTNKSRFCKYPHKIPSPPPMYQVYPKSPPSIFPIVSNLVKSSLTKPHYPIILVLFLPKLNRLLFGLSIGDSASLSRSLCLSLCVSVVGVVAAFSGISSFLSLLPPQKPDLDRTLILVGRNRLRVVLTTGLCGVAAPGRAGKDVPAPGVEEFVDEVWR